MTLTVAESDALLAAVVLDDETRQDPTPTYRRLREESPRWTSSFGMTVLAGYDDCNEYLRSPAWGRPEADMATASIGVAGRARNPGQSHAILFLNPPDHTRIRSLVSRAFTPRRVESLRAGIQALLTPILDDVASNGQAEIMAALAIPFPVAVISELLAVPRDGTGGFETLVRDSTALIDPAADSDALERAESAIGQLAEFFVDLIAYKRGHPDDGLLSAMTEVEAEGDRLSEEELVANTLLLYAAGFETTSNLIGNGLWALLRNPGEWARLRDDPGLIPSAVWEVLRYDSPVQLNGRSALVDAPLFDTVVERGTQLVLLQGAANHDATIYDHPERFDVGRFTGEGASLPLSFGAGAHHCLGAHLARAEGEVVFGEMVRRFERIELEGPAPRYRPSFTLRGLEHLDVVVTPRA